MGMTYLALGDSTTKTITTGLNYPTLVYQYIRDTYSPLKFIHKGESGLKAIDFLNNSWFFTYFDVDLITIGVGWNDLVASVDLNTFKSQVTTTIQKLKANNPNVKIICCTSNNGGSGNQPYREALIQVAESENTYYCRFENAWLSSENSTYTSDGTHPNTAGHQKLFELLQPIIDEILTT